MYHKNLNKTFQKPGSTTADKSFAIGTIGETLYEMGEASAEFCEVLYPHFLNMTQDEDEEVCSNAVFGLGVIMANGGQVMQPYPYLRSILVAYLQLIVTV